MLGYGNGILMAVLRPALEDAEGMAAAQVGTRLPADYIDRLPFVHARMTPGGQVRGPLVDTRFRAPGQIDVYATDTRSAHRIASECIAALDEAWREQTVYADGHVGRFWSVTGPDEFPEPDRADGVARFLVTFSLTVRPPAASTP